MFNAVVKLCRGSEKRAMDVLGVGPTQADVIAVNAGLSTEPTARADQVYTGVLFGELGLTSLSPAASSRAESSVVIASALFGVVRPSDQIPAYRLSAGSSLPRLGTIASRWRPYLPKALDALAGGGMLIDLRSGSYITLGKPTGDLAERTATVRVLHEAGGRRTVVSHFNKATKGRIVRALLESGADPATPEDLGKVLNDLGWASEQVGNRLDVIVTEV